MGERSVVGKIKPCSGYRNGFAAQARAGYAGSRSRTNGNCWRPAECRGRAEGTMAYRVDCQTALNRTASRKHPALLSVEFIVGCEDSSDLILVPKLCLGMTLSWP